MKIIRQENLSLSGAEQLIAIGKQIATEQGVTICLAIVDRSGHLLAFSRMDGAGLVSINVAIGKAHTAAYLGKPSKDFEDMINGGLPSMITTPGILPLAGGIPVKINEELIGGVGVSGATGEKDEYIAAETVARFVRTFAE